MLLILGRNELPRYLYVRVSEERRKRNSKALALATYSGTGFAPHPGPLTTELLGQLQISSSSAIGKGL